MPQDNRPPRRFDLTAKDDPLVCLGTSEIAELLDVSTRTVRRWIEEGRLPAVNIASQGSRPQYRILRIDLSNFIDPANTRKELN